MPLRHRWQCTLTIRPELLDNLIPAPPLQDALEKQNIKTFTLV